MLFEDQGYVINENRLINFFMGRGHITFDGDYDDGKLTFYDVAEAAVVFCKNRVEISESTNNDNNNSISESKESSMKIGK